MRVQNNLQKTIITQEPSNHQEPGLLSSLNILAKRVMTLGFCLLLIPGVLSARPLIDRCSDETCSSDSFSIFPKYETPVQSFDKDLYNFPHNGIFMPNTNTFAIKGM